jgi:hypothetical protein
VGDTVITRSVANPPGIDRPEGWCNPTGIDLTGGDSWGFVYSGRHICGSLQLL